jgi:hypothetical protein
VEATNALEPVIASCARREVTSRWAVMTSRLVAHHRQPYRRIMTTDIAEGSIDLSYADHTALIHTAWLTFVLVAAVLVPHVVLHAENPFSGLVTRFGYASIGGTMLVSIVAHELLHAVTVILFGTLRRDDVTFGINWNTLMPYAHPRKAVTARAYLLTAAAPGLVLGLVPSVIGLATGNEAWSAYGALMLAGAGGDLMIVRRVWRVKGSTLVRDHPKRVGCYIPPPSRG